MNGNESVGEGPKTMSGTKLPPTGVRGRGSPSRRSRVRLAALAAAPVRASPAVADYDAGRRHEHFGGTVKRTDMVAAFGGSR